MIDPESRCSVCGRVMQCFDDYTPEGIVEGYYFQCTNEKHPEAER